MNRPTRTVRESTSSADETAILLSTGLAAGLLGVAASLAHRPDALQQVELIAWVVTFNVAAVLIAAFVCRVAVVALSRDGSRGRQRWLLAIAVAATTGSVAVPLLRGPPASRSAAVILGVAGLLVATPVFVAVARAPRASRERRLVAVPLAAAATLILARGLAFAAEPSISTRIAWVVAYGAMLGVAGLAASRLPRLGTRKVLLAFVALVPLLAFLLGLSAGDGRPAARPKIDPEGRLPNVILVSVDTLRADALSAYGSGRDDTPRIDAFARQATSFLDARSSASWTLPALGSILTGTSPLVHRALARDSVLPLELDTLAERLAAAGYATGAIEANPYVRAGANFDQGFDEYHDFPRRRLGYSVGATLFRRLGFWKPETTERLTDRAIDWVGRHRDRRFFLWLHYMDPHLPYAPPAEYLTGVPIVPGIGTDFRDLVGVREGRTFSQDERDAVEALYRAEVRYVDDQLGRFFERLRGEGLFNDALIVFTSDHGEEFWEHGRFEHGHSMYDELLRVPLVVKLPAKDAPRGQVETVDASVTTIGILPTVLDLLGLEHVPEEFSYGSLVPLIRGNDAAAAEAVVSHGTLYYEGGTAVVFEGSKYIAASDREPERLFLLEGDPGEHDSVAASCAECVANGLRHVAEHDQASAELGERLGIGAGERSDLPAEIREQLEALGYIDSTD